VEEYGVAKQATDHTVLQIMRIACWIPRATNTHLEYAILFAFPLQQWLHERVTLYIQYSACLAIIIVSNKQTRILNNVFRPQKPLRK